MEIHDNKTEGLKNKRNQSLTLNSIHASRIYSNSIIMLTPLSLVVMRKLLYLKITRHALQMYENKSPKGLMILVPNLQNN